MAESSSKQRKPRGKGRPFQKGQSGNPGGRPKEVGHVRELARQHTELAINTLAEICQSADKDSARVAAATALLDRAWGKAPQEIQHAISAHQMDTKQLMSSLDEAIKVLREEGI